MRHVPDVCTSNKGTLLKMFMCVCLFLFLLSFLHSKRNNTLKEHTNINRVKVLQKLATLHILLAWLFYVLDIPHPGDR